MKLKALAVVSALALTAGAAQATYLETDLDDSNKYGVKIGTDAGIENFDINLKVSAKGAKAAYAGTDIGTSYKFKFDNGFFVQPSLDYTFKQSGSTTGSDVFTETHGDINIKDTYTYGYTHRFDTKNTDVLKAGLKFGYNFDSGLYTAARYRYEIGGLDRTLHTTEHMVDFKDMEFKDVKSSETRHLKVDRVDLTVGYALDTLTTQYNLVHKEMSGAVKGRATDHEFKATYTGFSSVAPYAQYTVKEKDNAFKVGMKYSF